MATKEWLDFAVKYWVQLLALGGLPVAALKILFDRFNKRDELRYSGLINIRNIEIKAYSQAMGEAFGKLNMLTVVIIDDKDDMHKLRDQFIEVYSALVKAYITLHFFIPARDEKALEKFHNNIIDVVTEAITLLNRYVTNRVQTVNEFKEELKVFVAKRETIAQSLDEVTPAVQHMVRSYNRIQRKWYSLW